MKLEYRLSLKDYQEAIHEHIKSRRFSYFFLWLLSILLIVEALYGLIFLGGTAANQIFVLFSLFMGAGINPEFNIFQKYTSYRLWKAQHNLHNSRETDVSEEGIKLKGEGFEANLEWKIYTHFIETKRLFILYQSKLCFNMFPKRAFSNEQQVEEFRELLQRKITKSR